MNFGDIFNFVLNEEDGTNRSSLCFTSFFYGFHLFCDYFSPFFFRDKENLIDEKVNSRLRNLTTGFLVSELYFKQASLFPFCGDCVIFVRER